MKFRYPKKKVRYQFISTENCTLFVDIVEFTKLGDNEKMRSAVQEIHSSVCDVFVKYQWDEVKENHLIMIPTGDGYGIVFCDEIKEAEVLELAVKLQKSITKKIKVRIGISKGPNIVYQDLNDKLNIIGWGINRAQRVMAIAGENEIICDSSFAEELLKKKETSDLEKIEEQKEIKHGNKVDIYKYKL